MLLDQVLDRVKRKWLKLVKVEKKSLFTLEQKDMDIIIQELQGKAFEQDNEDAHQNDENKLLSNCLDECKRKPQEAHNASIAERTLATYIRKTDPSSTLR